MQETLSNIKTAILELKDKFEFDYTVDRDQRLKNQSESIASQLCQITRQDQIDKKLEMHQRAQVTYLRALLLDLFSSYNKQAQDSINKSLNPSSYETWNALGHILWKKKSYQQSLEAYQNALTQGGKNKVTLREQSVVLRNVGKQSQKTSNVVHSIELAKEALLLDMKDGISWYLVGNAYMSNFFFSQKNIDQLQNAIKSYKKAQELLKYKNADLFLNRGNIYAYLQRYQQALSDYKIAEKLDPALQAQKLINTILNKLQLIKTTISHQTNVKPKQFANRLQQIPQTVKKQPKGGSYYPVRIIDIKDGLNKNTVLILKVIREVSKDESVPMSFICQSKCGQFCTASIYNCKADIYKYLQRGTILNIYDPYLRSIEVEDQKFKSVQIFQPSKLLADDQPLQEMYLPNRAKTEELQ